MDDDGTRDMVHDVPILRGCSVFTDWSWLKWEMCCDAVRVNVVAGVVGREYLELIVVVGVGDHENEKRLVAARMLPTLSNL